MAETFKAHERRKASGFYEKYIKGQGIDIGCGRIDTFDGIDTISMTDCVHHDKDDCDATTMDCACKGLIGERLWQQEQKY